MPTPQQPVVVLGGGINGAATARELLLEGLPVLLVDLHDLATGATARSSRLIHGGLRYLEYGEFDLVRESLAERGRLLELAPHLVRPLRLFIPGSRRLGGLVASARRLLTGGGGAHQPRGMWLVRSGLWMYDRFARGSNLPRRSHHRVGDAGTPPVDAARFRWLASYWDAQVLYPERLVLDLLADARQLADEAGVRFEVRTRHQARLVGRAIELRPSHSSGESSGDATERVEPAAVVNATGAWVDRALEGLGVEARPLMGGTKGSHLVTFHPALRAALDAGGLYVEARDGRPVFLLPLDDAVLVGTTDLPWEGDPGDVVASEAELDYLREAVHRVFPSVDVCREDVALHYCGVRPLPRSNAATPGAITRRHAIERHVAPLPLFSLVGGKLTTCRALAEQAADAVLAALDLSRRADSRSRRLPGAAGDLPATSPAKSRDDESAAVAALADATACDPQTAAAAWKLLGHRAEEILSAADEADRRLLDGTPLPLALARHALRIEWASTLADLVERRLMLLYRPRLTAACLRQLAELLVAEGKLPAADVDEAVAAEVARLAARFGKRVDD